MVIIEIKFYSSGFYKYFGSGEMNADGYILDDKTDIPFSRFPIIITDAHFICGRRFVFGANHMIIALQLIMDLLVAQENSTRSIELPRFYILQNGTLALEGKLLISIF